MRRLIEETQRQLADFVAQRQQYVLRVVVNEHDQNVFLQVVKDFDRSSDADVVQVFLDDFVSRLPYVDVLIERFRQQIQSANQMAAERGGNSLPGLSPEVDDPNLTPLERLRVALRDAASLLPQGDHRLVWVLCPQRIVDRAGWLAFLEEWVPSDHTVYPWMRRVRLVCRDNAPSPEPEWAKRPRVQNVTVDYGPAAVQASLNAEMEDETLPDERRFQALYTLAVMDGAHNRKALALSRYETLRGYYQQTGNLSMEALVLQSMGDCYRRSGELGMASDYYECAIDKAVDGQAWVVFFGALRNLAEVTYELGDYPLAEIYYERAEHLTSYLLDPEAKVQMREGCGLSQEKQGKYAEAATSFEAAVTFSRNVDLPPLLMANLRHLERVCARLDDPERLQRVRRDRESVAAKEGV